MSYKTEVDLCADFIASLDRDWTPYPETADWDILLVRNSDGFQIGIEAKLRLNARVIAQALEDVYQRKQGPDCRAVLVPYGKGSPDFDVIAAYIGLTVLKMRPPEQRGWSRPFTPHLPDLDRYRTPQRVWHELCPLQRHPLPEYVPDVSAGDTAPVKLTTWKINAIKIDVLLRTRGYVTRRDFKALGIDIRRWLPREQGWLQACEDGFRAGPQIPDFRNQHPMVWEQIRSEIDTWRPGVETAGKLL